MNATVRILSELQVNSLISLDDCIEAVERAFRADARAQTLNLPVVRESIGVGSGIFGIKSGAIFESQTLGLKAGGYWPSNARLHSTSNHQSTILLFDIASGQPTCLLNANRITELRTSAAGAIAARLLAKQDACTVGLVGAGVQARGQLEALLGVFPTLSAAHVWSRRREQAAALAEAMSDRLSVTVCDSPRQVAERADILVTATSSSTPLVFAPWLSPGVHINAIGSDTRGKQELDQEILRTAHVVVDNLEQACHLGEVQHLAPDIESAQAYVASTLGDILVGRKSGRADDREITVFDSTGVTFQDLAVAQLVYERACETGCGLVVEF